jgi:5-methylcytosine-specific restriction endonuclease McrA
MAMSTKKGDPRLSRKYREVRLRVLARDGYVCFYCGHEGQDGNNLTIDHIIPVSKSPELAIDESTCASHVSHAIVARVHAMSVFF